MKATLKNLFLALMLMTSFLSCNEEQLFVEPIVELVEDEDTIEEDTEEETQVDTSLVCDFDLNNVQPNSTIIINCVLDLLGKTIALPSGVTIDYEGGDIINGTIRFSDNSFISGELLNANLTFGGSSPQLKDPTFHFVPESWGIVEGIVSDDVAIANRDIINKAINLTKELGGYTFVIDKIDAYFDVSTATGSPRHDTETSILIPSNFHFKMGDDCNLRVQPNGVERSVLVHSRSTENVLISGGKLWGDRYTHDYTTINSTHDWGHIIMFRGVHNSVIDGVEMHEGTGDGFEIGGLEHRNNDGSIKPHGRESNNVTVKNCLINDNRRNNISIVDGTDLYFEYNTITNSGSGDINPGVIDSNGISPRAGIDIEAFKHTDLETHTIWDWELTQNIHIRNNIFENNFSTDIAIFSGETNFIYENTFRSKRGVSTSFGCNNKIYNNNFERPEGLMSGSYAINLEPVFWKNDGTHRVTDFELYGNNILGYQFGIIIGGKDQIIRDNSFINCQRGIILATSINLEFDNNTISSNISNSYGYYTFSAETSIKNTIIKNGATDVKGKGLFFSDINNDTVGEITIDNIDFNGSISLINAQSVTVQNSTYESISITDCSPVLKNNN